MASFSVSFFVSCALFAFSSAANQKIDVSVYYEALCPDSVKFIKTQLYPTFNSELGKFMTLHMFPFGRSTYHKESEKYIFECKHGPTECEVDKAQACVIKTAPSDEKKVLKFIECTMGADGVKNSEKCLKEANVTSLESFKNCTDGEDGSKFLYEIGADTQKLESPLASVPRVDINNKFNSSEQSALLDDFKSAICSYITGPKPEECSKKSGASALVATLLPLVSVLILTRINY